MSFEKILDELKTLKDERPEICEKIKSHNLPVIIYGSAQTAKRITNTLNSFGVEIDGYAVDEKYFKPNQTYLNCPVYNFAELSAEPNKYVFVLGFYDNNRGTRSVEFMNNNKIIHYEFIDRVYNDSITAEYIFNNTEKFAETFYCLADEFSKKTLTEFLKLKITYNMKYNFEIYKPIQYFNEVTNGVRTPNGGGYVDCGAFNGDTVEKFINWSGSNYSKIFAVEADPLNFAALEKFLAEKIYKNVVAVNCGVWNEKTTLTFSDTNDVYSTVSDEGKIIIATDTIDNITGGEKIKFIKMDIEGAELPALQGAAETIKTFKPTLAICAYHKAEDLITLPQFIKSLNPDYKFYLRKHSLITDTELVLYAIP